MQLDPQWRRRPIFFLDKRCDVWYCGVMNRKNVINEIIYDMGADGNLILEMSTVARDFVHNMSIAVNPDDSRNNPLYFKLFDSTNYLKATRCARIRFMEAKYEPPHKDSKENWVLNSHERRALVEFLKSHIRGRKQERSELSNWEYAIASWNVEMHYIDNQSEAADLVPGATPLPLCTPMPDYLLLR